MLVPMRSPRVAMEQLAYLFNPFVPTVVFSQLSSNVCCPRDCVYRHNGGTSVAPLIPLRVDSALRRSALRTLSTLRGLRGAPEVPPLCRETQSLGQQMLKEPLGINGLILYFHINYVHI